MTHLNFSKERCLRKIAASPNWARRLYGNLVNAGYSAMTMGSPYAPKPYAHDTGRLKSTEELRKDQLSTAKGGVYGAAIGLPLVGIGSGLLASSAMYGAADGISSMVDGKGWRESAKDAIGGTIAGAVLGPAINRAGRLVGTAARSPTVRSAAADATSAVTSSMNFIRNDSTLTR